MTANPITFIQPLPVVRDSDGFWFHVGVPNFDEGEEEQYKAWLTNQGLVTAVKMLESEDDTYPVYVSYFDEGNANISAWEPSSPAGAGWFTISIHDTEDGPVWVWARRVPDTGIDDLQDDDGAVFDDHAVDLFSRAMKDKLRVKRQQGFGGWHDISRCSGERLAELLLAAVAKGDPVDVANFAMMLFCRHENHDALKTAYAKVGTEALSCTTQWAEFPAKCPITRRDFFMVIGHPELGMVPTYGGPYDSYSIPEMEGAPTDPFHERALFVRRYDHDRGYWVDNEDLPMRVISENSLQELQEGGL